MNIYFIEMTEKGYDTLLNLAIIRYEYSGAHVVVAESCEQARKLIIETEFAIGDEGSPLWLDEELSTCELIGISNKEKPQVVLTSQRNL